MPFVNQVTKIISKSSQIALLILALGAIFLLLQIYGEEGVIGIWKTFRVDVIDATKKFIPILIIFFTITGALDHLQKRHEKEFNDIITGKSGTVKMVALAASLPGPAGGQQLQDAWNKKDSNKTKLLLCLVGMMAFNINMVLFRSKVLGGELTLIWLAMSCALIFQVWLICKLKPWLWFQ